MEAKRTLVKSPPELWAELSDVAALARHLGEFGEIRITRTEPESVVEWEGDLASGSVRLEPSGWGTNVTLTALPVMIDPPPPAPEPEPEPVPEPPAPPRPGFWARLFRRRAPPAPEPAPAPPPSEPRRAGDPDPRPREADGPGRRARRARRRAPPPVLALIARVRAGGDAGATACSHCTDLDTPLYRRVARRTPR